MISGKKKKKSISSIVCIQKSQEKIQILSKDKGKKMQTSFKNPAKCVNFTKESWKNTTIFKKILQEKIKTL